MQRYHLLAILFAFVAAFAGVWLGRTVFVPESTIENRFHDLMHNELELDAAQQARIEALERSFVVTQAAYEREMRQDNKELARAIQAEKVYGPKVARAIDRSHMAMGMLQKKTMQHLFAMRAVLHPDQAARFDAALIEALTAPEQ